MSDKIKVGDTVMHRGCWGADAPKKAVITSIELCKNEREKYGIDMQEVYAKDKDRCCFTLDNGHWAYGEQIDLITKTIIA